MFSTILDSHLLTKGGTFFKSFSCYSKNKGIFTEVLKTMTSVKGIDTFWHLLTDVKNLYHNQIWTWMKTVRGPHWSQQGASVHLNAHHLVSLGIYINNTVSEITAPNEASSFSLAHKHTRTNRVKRKLVLCVNLWPLFCWLHSMLYSAPVVCHSCIDNRCPCTRLLGVFGLTSLALWDAASEAT